MTHNKLVLILATTRGRKLTGKPHTLGPEGVRELCGPLGKPCEDLKRQVHIPVRICSKLHLGDVEWIQWWQHTKDVLHNALGWPFCNAHAPGYASSSLNIKITQKQPTTRRCIGLLQRSFKTNLHKVIFLAPEWSTYHVKLTTKTVNSDYK